MTKKMPVLLVLMVIIYTGCFDFSGDKKSEIRPVCQNLKAEALVIVAENMGMPGGTMEYLYDNRKDAMLDIFAEVFNVQKTEIQNLSLADIFDLYGEDWQIDQMKKAATPYYQEIISLTDSSATREGFLAALRDLSGKGFTIDIIFALHANSYSVLFFDGSAGIEGLTDAIESESIAVRSLYQTCCYGSFMIDDWARIGVTAVNGASGTNAIVMFSPIYFIQNWTGGSSFADAVLSAYEMEKAKLKSYSNTVPEFAIFINDSNLASSMQITGGCDNLLGW